MAELTGRMGLCYLVGELDVLAIVQTFKAQAQAPCCLFSSVGCSKWRFDVKLHDKLKAYGLGKNSARRQGLLLGKHLPFYASLTRPLQTLPRKNRRCLGSAATKTISHPSRKTGLDLDS